MGADKHLRVDITEGDMLDIMLGDNGVYTPVICADLANWDSRTRTYILTEAEMERLHTRLTEVLSRRTS